MQKNLYIEAALAAVKAAEELINYYYKADFSVDFKEDQSPVTIADIESEKRIKSVLTQYFPDHGFYGEETGRQNSEAEFVWLIDPIDGTKSFVRGIPFFSTQIALLHNSAKGAELIAGISNASQFGELAFASQGQGAVLQGKPIRVSAIKTLREATLSFGNIGSLAKSAQWPAFGRLLPELNRVRGYGDFYHYHLLASGKIDIVIESDLNILDIAALTVIVREAGGVMTTLEGEPISLSTRSVLAAATPDLHDLVLRKLSGG